MSNLENQSPAETYKGLLQVNDYTEGVNATAKYIQDGEGTNSALAISSTAVGIGTTSPDAPLTVVEVSNVGINVLKSNGGSVLKIGEDGGGNAVYNAALSGDHIFQNTGTERMRITSSGDVGIGTTSPDAALHISTHSPSIRLTDTTPATDTASQVWADSDAVGALFLAADITNVGTDPFISFRVAGLAQASEKMRITSSGNVGIGTTSPISPLTVWGANDTTFDNIGNVTFIGTDAYDSNAGAGIIFGGRYNSNNDVTTFGQISSTKENNTDGNYKAALTFGTRDGSTTTMEKMRITSSGDVGIGTTSPSSKLEITDSTNHLNLKVPDKISQSVVKFSDKDGIGATINYDHNADKLHFITDGTATPTNGALNIDSAGKVGIGTTSPGSYKLNVNGDVFANSYTPTSDDRVKHNEQPIIGALETLSKITPKKYIKTVEMYEANHDFELDADGNPVDENGEPVEHRIEAGVIAQQVLTVDELAFAVSPEGVDEDGSVTSPHGLDYNSLFTYAIAAIQEQQTIIEDLKSEIEQLKS